MMAYSRASRALISLADKLLVLFVFFPLAIFQWRGTWHLQDVYLFPSQTFLSSWVSLALGCTLGIILPLVHPPLVKSLGTKPRWVYLVGIRFYLYITGWAILCYWRGMWNLVDFYLTEGWINSLVIYAVAQMLSLLLRTSRTNAGLPLSLQLDIDADLDRPDTRFGIQPTELGKFFLDICFTQFIIVTINVLVWRGIWNVIDAFLLPEDHLISDLASLGYGYLSVILLYTMEYPMAKASSRLDGYHVVYKLLYEGVLMTIATWALMLMWRGAWDICRDYIIPDRKVGGWVCHLVGATGLMALQGFSNVGTNGIDIDGTYVGGEGIFPLQYIRYYFIERVKFKTKPSHSKFSELENLVSEDVEKKVDADAGSDGEYYADSELSTESTEDSAPLTGTKSKKKKKKIQKYQNGSIL